METAPNFHGVDYRSLPLIKKLLDAGANPNPSVNNTPEDECGKVRSHRVRNAFDARAFSGDRSWSGFSFHMGRPTIC